MNIINTAIEGVLIIEPRVFGDSRGYFFESFNLRDFRQQTGIDVDFVQDNESLSHQGVVRGLHFQRPPFSQAKLVRVVEGEVLDVAVDLRRGSPTYGHHVSAVLSGSNHRQFFIPKGFAHGFAVLSTHALFQYKCDEYYHPEAEGAIAWDDPTLAIDWQLDPARVELSDKDRHHPLFADFQSPFAL